MAIDSDFTIDTTYKSIIHTSGTTVYTVNELYSWLMNAFDEEAYMRYEEPMSAQTPTEYTLINSWFMDDQSMKYLSGGAISTSGWDAATDADGIRILTFTANPNTVGTDVDKVVAYSGGSPTDTGRLLAYDNTLKRWWVRVDGTDDTFANTSTAVVITSGTGTGTLSVASTTGECQFSNIYTLGSLVSSTTIYVYQNDTKLTTWWSTGHIDIVVKVKESGTEIDSGNLTVFARTYGSLYDHYTIDASTGRNPVPLAAFDDTNNDTAQGTVDTYSDITFDFGYTTQNLNNGNGAVPYDVIIDCAGRTLAQVYEYLKNVTRAGATTPLSTSYGTNGEYYTGVGDIRFNYDNEAVANFQEGELLTATGGVRGYLVSLKDDGTTGTMVVRNVHGTFADNLTLTGGTSTATCQVNGSVTSITPVKQSPFGTFAGGTFFGARGVWITDYHADDANNFSLIDSTGTPQNPPTTVPISVGGLISGDRVSVFRTTGDNEIINKSMYTSHNANNSAGDNTFDVTTTISSDTPTTGNIRVVNRDTNGNIINEQTYAYTSWSGTTFSGISPVLSQSYDSYDTVYVPLIDKETSSTSESVSISYSSPFYVITIVRKKGIVPFKIKGQVGASGLSVTAIRTTDTIVA